MANVDSGFIIPSNLRTLTYRPMERGSVKIWKTRHEISVDIHGYFYSVVSHHVVSPYSRYCGRAIQEGLAVASIARDDPSTLLGDDPFPRANMHRDRNAR